jgi:energy-coupling factor transporter transmembrane protein EcfT
MHHVEKLCNILYVLLFGILLIVVMGSMFTWSFRMAWILPIFVALFIIYVTKKKRILKEEWCSVLWYIVYGACLVFLIAFSFLCEVAPSWDWGQVLESASEYVLNGTLDAKEYYAR